VIAIVDSGPLYAVVDAGDDDHARCVEVLERSDLQLVIPTLVAAEVSYIVGRRLGPTIEAAFLRGLERFDVAAPRAEEWVAIAELVERYADFPLGAADASVAVLAERLGTDLIVTLDQRHFSAVVPKQWPALRLLPA
jgi:uncharacterized protein